MHQTEYSTLGRVSVCVDRRHSFRPKVMEVKFSVSLCPLRHGAGHTPVCLNSAAVHCTLQKYFHFDLMVLGGESIGEQLIETVGTLFSGRASARAAHRDSSGYVTQKNAISMPGSGSH